jgi:hypothetical protein
MESAEITLAASTDIDGFLLDYIPTTDGIWSLAGFDDDRSVFAWSPAHATRCVEQLAIARNRVAAAEWALADVQRRGLAAAVAKAGAHVARARAELAEWEAKTQQQEAFRKVTPGASPVSLID